MTKEVMPDVTKAKVATKPVGFDYGDLYVRFTTVGVRQPKQMERPTAQPNSIIDIMNA